MKILKKIGIGCLALIVCFCSCFKFINAETLVEPFNLYFNETYLLVIDNNAISNEENYVAYSDNVDIFYHPGELSFVTTTDDETSITTSTSLTFVKEDNGYSYYSFVYIIADNLFHYEDIEVAYIETLENNSFSVYDTIYDLIETYIFGGNIDPGSHQDLTATILSSFLCILVFALPFLVVWKLIKTIMG